MSDEVKYQTKHKPVWASGQETKIRLRPLSQGNVVLSMNGTDRVSFILPCAPGNCRLRPILNGIVAVSAVAPVAKDIRPVKYWSSMISRVVVNLNSAMIDDVVNFQRLYNVKKTISENPETERGQFQLGVFNHHTTQATFVAANIAAGTASFPFRAELGVRGSFLGQNYLIPMAGMNQSAVQIDVYLAAPESWMYNSTDAVEITAATVTFSQLMLELEYVPDPSFLNQVSAKGWRTEFYRYYYQTFTGQNGTGNYQLNVNARSLRRIYCFFETAADLTDMETAIIKQRKLQEFATFADNINVPTVMAAQITYQGQNRYIENLDGWGVHRETVASSYKGRNAIALGNTTALAALVDVAPTAAMAEIGIGFPQRIPQYFGKSPGCIMVFSVGGSYYENAYAGLDTTSNNASMILQLNIGGGTCTDKRLCVFYECDASLELAAGGGSANLKS